MEDVAFEILRAVLAVAVATASLLVGSLLGHRLSRSWDEKRRRRELDLAALASFYRLYGEFFAVWKAWSTTLPRQGDNYISPQPDVAWKLLERACEVEGGFEALLVKVSLERNLSARDVDTLARFRQAYQSLRETIRLNKPLEWRAASGQGAASSKYLAYKRLAADFAQLLTSQDGHAHDSSTAGDTLVRATSAEPRESWWELKDRPTAGTDLASDSRHRK